MNKYIEQLNKNIITLKDYIQGNVSSIEGIHDKLDSFDKDISDIKNKYITIVSSNNTSNGGEIDPSVLIPLENSVNITQAGLMSSIASSSLIAGQWYLVTDYRTNLPVMGTESDFFLGDVEEIMLLATSANTIASQGYSKSFPDEIIEFNQNVITYLEIKFAEYDDGDNYGDMDITPVTANSFTVNVDLGDPLTWDPDEFYFYGEDYDNEEEMEFEYSDMGTGWTYNQATQTFTFPNAASIPFSFLNGGFYELYVGFASPNVTNGHIVSRRNVKNDVYIESDYRGRKLRRWQSDAVAWSAGTTPALTDRSHSGYIWYSLVSTTDTPSTSSSDWIRLVRTGYVVPTEGMNAKYNIGVDQSDFEDQFMFDVSVLDDEDEKRNINLEIHSDQAGNCNVKFVNGILESTNSKIYTDGPVTINEYVSDSNARIGFAYVNAISRSEIGELNSVIVSNFLVSVKANRIQNCSMYQLVKARFSELVSSAFAGNSNVDDIDVSTFQNNTIHAEYTNVKASVVISCTHMDKVENMSASYVQGNTHTGQLTNVSLAGKFYNNTFTAASVDRLRGFADIYSNTISAGIGGLDISSQFDNNNISGLLIAARIGRCYGNTFTNLTIINTTFNDSFNTNNQTSGTAVRLYNNVFNEAFNGNEFGNLGDTYFYNNVMQSVNTNEFAKRSAGNVTISANIIQAEFNGSDLDNCEFLKNRGGAISGLDLDDASIQRNQFGASWQSTTVSGGTLVYDSVFPTDYNSNTITADLIDANLSEKESPEGATAVLAGAISGQTWVTLGHATLPDGVQMRA